MMFLRGDNILEHGTVHGRVAQPRAYATERGQMLKCEAREENKAGFD
jgi:hypothetical protein